jgi:hypothetical protein
MTEDLEKLKKYLPKGYCTILAKEFGVTEVTASNALMGKHRRFDIITRAIEMAKETIRMQKELKETISEVEQ